MPSNIASLYNNPQTQQYQSDMATANTNENNALNAYNSWVNSQPTFADNLKSALMSKVGNNQDLITNDTNALKDVQNSVQNAQNLSSNLPTYNGISNPYAQQDAMQNQYNDNYARWSEANKLLSQRTGDISNLVDSGTNAYQAGENAADSAYKASQQNYQNAKDAWNNYYQNVVSPQVAYNSAVDAAKIYAGAYGSGSSAATTPQNYQTAWNAYQSYINNAGGERGTNAAALPNSNPYQVQNNLYNYLMTGPGAALDSATKQQMWNQWQQFNSAYKNKLGNQSKTSQARGGSPQGFIARPAGALLGDAGNFIGDIWQHAFQ